MNYADSHCHLNSPELRSDIPAELERCRHCGVEKLMLVGSTLADSLEAFNLCRQYPEYGLYCSAGIHPHEVQDVASGLPQPMKDLIANPQVKALGEIGLDYHYDISPRDLQLQILEEQLHLAVKLDKTVIFHVREAYDDFWKLIERVSPPKAVLHCFSGTQEDAKRALDRGWYIGVTGVITFVHAEEFRDVIAKVPLESLLCETDSPWMSPVPFRGTVNRPSRVMLVYKKLAEVKKMSLERVVSQIWENCGKFFNWGV